MECSLCRKHPKLYPAALDDPRHMVLLDMDHAESEDYGQYCAACKKVFCGACCLPKWAALKKEKGLDGKALAAVLNADPDACFFELPSCPTCKGRTDPLSPGKAREAGLSTCFIATAACGTPEHPDVRVLRSYRDERLMKTPFGRLLVGLYQRSSPPIADLIRSRPWARSLVKAVLIRPLAGFVGSRSAKSS